jgi:hypothetical protein
MMRRIRLPSFANSENLVVPDEPKLDEPIPDDVPILELAEQVARGKRKLSREQMRMLIELLPYHAPKLSAISVGYLNATDFASRLDRAIDRSERARLIEGQVVEVEDR